MTEKTAYIDSSTMKKMLKGDDVSKLIEKKLNDYSQKVSSALVESEIPKEALTAGITQKRAEKLLTEFSLFHPDRSLVWENLRIFKSEATNQISDVTAHHLSCALYLHQGGWDMDFVTSDENTAEVAKKLELPVVKI